MALGDEIDEVFRREVKSLPAYAKAQAAGGSGVAPPVEEMNHLLMGLALRCSVRFTCSPTASRTWRRRNTRPSDRPCLGGGLGMNIGRRCPAHSSSGSTAGRKSDSATGSRLWWNQARWL